MTSPAWVKRLAPLLVLCWLLGTAWAFWWFQFRFLPPVEVPLLSHEQLIQLAEQLPSSETPRVVHFFNPDCLCSRFNESHVRMIIRRYQQLGVEFAVLVPAPTQIALAERVFGVPAFSYALDAAQLYTPMALVLDHQADLAYIGSYSDSLLCTFETGQLIEDALDALLNNQRPTLQQASGSCTCPWPTSSERSVI